MSFFPIDESLLSGDEIPSKEDIVLMFLRSMSAAPYLSDSLLRGLSFLVFVLLSLLGDGEARIGESSI